MLVKIEINVKSFLRSGLSLDEFTLLVLLWRKEFETITVIYDTRFGFGEAVLQEVLAELESDGWLKITGAIPQGVELRQKFIDCLSPSSEEVAESYVSHWIDEYRGLFKGKKIGAMGDRATCLKNMIRFMAEYDQYSKDDILKAAKLYIQSCSPSYRYLKQADYFISKQEANGDVKSVLLSTLEDMKAGTFAESGGMSREI